MWRKEHGQRGRVRVLGGQNLRSGEAFSRSISSSLIDTHAGRTECGDLRDKLEN